jgi:hypothetical protein
MREARLDGRPVALTIIRISSCIASPSVPISFMAEARKDLGDGVTEGSEKTKLAGEWP